MKIHATEATLNAILERIDFMTSMYLPGGMKVAPINQATIFNSFRDVRMSLDALEIMSTSNPAGKNMDGEDYLPWED